MELNPYTGSGIRLPTVSAVTSSTPRTGYDQYPSSLWRPSLLLPLELPAGIPRPKIETLTSIGGTCPFSDEEFATI